VAWQRPHAQHRRREGHDPRQRLDRDAKSALLTTTPWQAELLAQRWVQKACGDDIEWNHRRAR
jgi:hypothetical protein